MADDARKALEALAERAARSGIKTQALGAPVANIQENRRVQENRRKGRESAIRAVEEERRLGVERRQQIYEDVFDLNIDEPESNVPTNLDEWLNLSDDEFVKSGARSPHTIGSPSHVSEADIEIPAGAKERIFSGVKKDIALQGLNRRVKGYGIAGTLADMATAYSLADGTPMQRGYEASKAGLKGAATGMGMQAAINATGRLGAIAGRGLPIVGGMMGAWNIGKAARGAVDWRDAARRAAAEKAASESKYGTIEAAKLTRHSKMVGAEPDQINRMTDRYGRWSRFRSPTYDGTYLPGAESITDKIREF